MLIFSPIEKFDIICYIPFDFFGADLSLTNFTIYLFFFLLTFLMMFFFSLRNVFVPSFFQMILEGFLKFIFDIVHKQIGVKGYVFFPFFVVLFFIVLLCNVYGLAPCSFSPTAHVVFTFFFSGLIGISAIILGLLENGISFYKLFVPDVPAFLLPFLVIIEIFSYIIRVFSLAIRLAANITAGHVLMFTIAGFSVNFAAINLFMFGLTMVALTLIMVLEVGVAFIQAYVFVTLACMYFNDSLNLAH